RRPSHHLMTPKASSQAKRIGRPPAGARAGEKVKDYPQLSIRLPDEVKAKLQALSLVAARPQWRVITEAIEGYLGQRTEAEKKMIDALVGRRVRNRKPRRSMPTR